MPHLKCTSVCCVEKRRVWRYRRHTGVDVRVWEERISAVSTKKGLEDLETSWRSFAVLLGPSANFFFDAKLRFALLSPFISRVSLKNFQERFWIACYSPVLLCFRKCPLSRIGYPKNCYRETNFSGTRFWLSKFPARLQPALSRLSPSPAGSSELSLFAESWLLQILKKKMKWNILVIKNGIFFWLSDDNA